MNTCKHLETCEAGYHPLVGDGYCNDETNNDECKFDGGDCCGTCVNKHRCADCLCFSSVTGNGVPNALVGNGICNNETNNKDCNYDGFDCCGLDIDQNFCHGNYQKYNRLAAVKQIFFFFKAKKKICESNCQVLILQFSTVFKNYVFFRLLYWL